MSKFVSGGTIDEPIERDDEWAKAQRELEEAARKREEEKDQNGGKSLFEILEANKAAKQEAFEEANRFKNQFRALDDEEVEFLDSVLEADRAKDAAIKKETREKLDAFRRQQEEAEKAVFADEDTAAPAVEEEQLFAVGKKRKKGKEKEGLRGLKLRKTSSTSEQPSPALKAAVKTDTETKAVQAASASSKEASNSKDAKVAGMNPGQKTLAISASPSASPPAQSPKTSILGLGNYSSDDGD